MWRFGIGVVVLLGLAAGGVGAWRRWQKPAAVLTEPWQQLVSGRSAEWEKAGWTLTPLAEFRIQARVLGVKPYREGPTAALAPLDLALGWGPMAEEAVLEKLQITQSGRFYHWRYWGKAPLAEEDIVRCSTNAHLIPRGEEMERKLLALKKDQWVELQGWLVEARHPAADRPWRSSLVRDDRGDGACEIIYVKALQHISGRQGKL